MDLIQSARIDVQVFKKDHQVRQMAQTTFQGISHSSDLLLDIQLIAIFLPALADYELAYEL